MTTPKNDAPPPLTPPSLRGLRDGEGTPRGVGGGGMLTAPLVAGGCVRVNPRWEYGVRRGPGMAFSRIFFHASPQCTLSHFPHSRIPLWQRASSPRNRNVCPNRWGAGEGGAHP